MNFRRSPYLPLALCIVGFTGGFVTKRRSVATSHGQGAASGLPHHAVAAPHKSGDRGDAAAAFLQATASGLHSTDTVETLLTAPDAEAYHRIALWLVDAPAVEIKTFWERMQEKAGWNAPVEELVLLVWTRVDLAAALSAGKSDGYESEARVMWAVHDPEGALASARNGGPDFMEDIISGLAFYRPAWLRAHLSEFPKSLQWLAFSDSPPLGLDGDPAEVLDFISKNHGYFDKQTYATVVASDPLAAYQWIFNHPRSDSDGSLTAQALAELARKDPAELQRMAGETRSAEVRRQMESALFKRLLENDPQAALEQALATTAPLVAAERLAAVAVGTVAKDPAHARELVDRLFTVDPVFPVGEELKGVMKDLIRTDPESMLSLPSVQRALEADSRSFLFWTLAEVWLDQDEAAFVEWTMQQNVSPARAIASVTISHHLSEQGDDEGAAEWALDTVGDGPCMALVEALIGWSKKDRFEASRWLESCSLTEQKKERFRWVVRP